MGNHRVTFHLSKSYTATLFATLDRLMCDRINRPCRTHLKFIGNHMPQSLIVDDSKEDLHLKNSLIDYFPIIHLEEMPLTLH